MSEPLVSDALWAVIEPLLPPEPPKPKGGRPRVPDRAALTGILFVLRSGIPWEMLPWEMLPWEMLPWEMLPWEMLPQEMGCGSGMTCWRRLRDWQQAGSGTSSSACSSTASGGAMPSTSGGRLSTARLSLPKGGLGDRSQPDGSRQGGHQASRPHRCARHPARDPADRSQRPRQRRTGRDGRCRTARPAVLGTTPTQARQAPRRQGL